MTSLAVVRLTGALIFLAGAQLSFHRSSPNGWSGLRLPWTLADPEVWDRANRVAGYLMALYSTIFFLPLPARTIVLLTVPGAALAGSLASLYARSLYRSRHGTVRTVFVGFGRYEPVSKS